jgi:hypothetical protein
LRNPEASITSGFASPIENKYLEDNARYGITGGFEEAFFSAALYTLSKVSNLKISVIIFVQKPGDYSLDPQEVGDQQDELGP